jgi:hypothetical protein
MKEQIKKKIDEYIQSILDKTELTMTDFMFLVTVYKDLKDEN